MRPPVEWAKLFMQNRMRAFGSPRKQRVPAGHADPPRRTSRPVNGKYRRKNANLAVPVRAEFLNEDGEPGEIDPYLA
jgi:hypothetical protein